MLSRAVRVGTRLNDWKMNPTRSRRIRVYPGVVEEPDLLVPDEETRPEVGVSTRPCNAATSTTDPMGP